MKHFTNNPRQISKRQFEKLKSSMLKYGDLSGITHILETDELITGNQRSDAGDFINSSPIITERFNPPLPDCTVAVGYFEIDGRRFNYRAVKGWSRNEQQEANLIANAAGGNWDWDLLGTFDKAILLSSGFDADLFKSLKMDVKGIDGLIKSNAPESSDAEPQIDRAAELLEKWGVKLGDLWQIGEHRLICGDCTDAAVVARVMDIQADLQIIDPPYGISYDGESHPETVEWDVIEGDQDTKIAEYLINQISDKQSAVVFGANCFPSLFPRRGRWLCWDKRITEEADRMLGSPFELAWMNKTSGFDVMIRVLHGGVVNADGGKRVHPTQKPVELYSKIIELYKAQSVYDPCLGSGTSIVACQNLSRRCRAVEISPAYCSVTLERMSQAFPSLPITRIEQEAE